MKKISTIISCLIVVMALQSCGGGNGGGRSDDELEEGTGIVRGYVDLDVLDVSMSARGTGKSISGNMGAVVAVADTGLYDVTSEDGYFEICNVPEGNQRLYVFAMRDGTVHRYVRDEVSVTAGESTDLIDMIASRLIEQMEDAGFTDDEIFSFFTNDTDGDGVPDTFDDFPLDPTEISDLDGDGTGDNADAFPADSTEWADNDGDGTGNNADDDSDNDGIPDELDHDADNDGVIDSEDAFPNDSSEWADSDGDGMGNNTDNCVHAANAKQEDCDGDGTGGACDDDEIGSFTENISGNKCIYDHLTIGSGQTMTIAAGSRLEFWKGKGIFIAEGGTLNIAGTAAGEVTLTSRQADPEAEVNTIEWNGIYAFEGASGGTWTHVNFEYAGFDYAPIYLCDGNYTITDIDFDYCRGWQMIFRQPVTGNFSNWTISATNRDISPRLNLCSITMNNFTSTGQNRGIIVNYGNNSMDNIVVNDARCIGIHFGAVTAGTFSNFTINGGGSGINCIAGSTPSKAFFANTNTNTTIDGLTVNEGNWTYDVYVEDGSSLDY